jgi:hypothetical protein
MVNIGIFNSFNNIAYQFWRENRISICSYYYLTLSSFKADMCRWTWYVSKSHQKEGLKPKGLAYAERAIEYIDAYIETIGSWQWLAMEKRKLKSEIINALKGLKQAITNARRKEEKRR